jgi:dTDP-4-amino-4,6-dideoxygalactose transaminase
MNPAALEAAVEKAARLTTPLTGRPRAVIPVHYGGVLCDMDAICAVARKYNLAVVEDAAHAFPVRDSQGRHAGTLGDIGVFSFYATKTLTTGEGGMVVTADEKLAARISVMRSHGIDRSVWNRYSDTKASWYYEVIAPGYKYNLPDLLAAVGREQLKKAGEMLAMRRDIAARYSGAFAARPEQFILPPDASSYAWHLYPLRLRDAAARDGFIEKLQEKGIGVSVHFIPLHIMPYYRDRYKIKAEDFPESYRRFRETVSLPVWPGMSGEQIERVINAVLECAGR